MKKKRIAMVILAKCPKHKKIYGIRTELISDKHWLMTWAFPITEQIAKREKFEKSFIRGNISQSIDFPGCPYCGNKQWGVCSCGHVVCCKGIKFHCPWCDMDGIWSGHFNGVLDAGQDV